MKPARVCQCVFTTLEKSVVTLRDSLVPRQLPNAFGNEAICGRRAYSWLSSFHFTLVWNRVLREMATSLLVQFSFLSRLHPLLYSPGGTTIRRQRAFLPFSNVVSISIIYNALYTSTYLSFVKGLGIKKNPRQPNPCIRYSPYTVIEQFKVKAGCIWLASLVWFPDTF